MTTLLAIDPGLRYPARAFFVDGELVAASRVPIPRGVTTRTPVLERCRAIAIALIGDYRPEIVVTEYPQIYTREKSKGDPNKLIPLAAIGACIAGLLPDTKVISPRPNECWGNVKKNEDGDPWESPRGRKIWKRLSVAERGRVIPSHDSIDAVGLGLFGLGRFERRRVYESG
jgi:hypothetical protein